MTESTSPKKLYRSGTDHVLAGVCAGVADYFHTDPLLIRILWFMTIFLNGLGLLAYLIFMIVVPLNPDHAALPPSEKKKNGQVGLYIGIAMVIFGLMFLSSNLMGHFHYWMDFPWFGFWPFSWRFIWPVLIIAFGVWYIVYSTQKKQHDQPDAASAPGYHRLTRIRDNRMVSGVCSGLAVYWNLDVTLVRIGFVLLTLITHLIVGIGIYVAMAIVVPEAGMLEQPGKPEEQTPNSGE